jgi:hypothetical protein
VQVSTEAPAPVAEIFPNPASSLINEA